MRRMPNGSEYEKYSIAAALGFQSLSGSDKFTGQVQPAYSARPQIRFRVVCLAERRVLPGRGIAKFNCSAPSFDVPDRGS